MTGHSLCRLRTVAYLLLEPGTGFVRVRVAMTRGTHAEAVPDAARICQAQKPTRMVSTSD